MIVRTAKDVGAVIRERRKQLKLDQRGLAERIGVSRQWIIAVEKGKSRAEVGLILKALAALGLRLRIDDAASFTLADGEARADVPAGPDIDAIVANARKRPSHPARRAPAATTRTATGHKKRMAVKKRRSS